MNSPIFRTTMFSSTTTSPIRGRSAPPIRSGTAPLYADLLYQNGLRSGFANTEKLPAYYPLNLGLSHRFDIPGFTAMTVRFDVVNLLDQAYEIRDGSGIGVGAPQWGSRRGCYGGVTFAF